MLNEYITDNNLPCKIWLDSTNLSNITVTGNTFTWLNSQAYPDYSFQQLDSAKHPLITSKGISFSANQVLNIVNNTVFNNVNSYSLVLITAGTNLQDKTAIQITKNNPSLPKYLDIKYRTSKVLKYFSLNQLNSSLENSNEGDIVEQLLINHNIELGRTEFSLNNSPFIPQQNTNKGHVLNNLSSNFYLGNAETSNPFTGRIIHFLLFTPAITNEQLLEVSNFLTDTEALLQNSDEFNLSNSYVLDIDTNLTFNPSIVYTSPVITYSTYASSLNTPNLLGTLTLAYVWDELITAQWDTLTETDWNTLLKGNYT